VSTRTARAATARADRHVSSILTSGLALARHYASARPDCQVLASIRYGPIVLRASCDQRRSTTGKGTPPVRLPSPGALLEVTAARDACQQAAAPRGAVACARQAGHPRRSTESPAKQPGNASAATPLQIIFMITLT